MLKKKNVLKATVVAVMLLAVVLTITLLSTNTKEVEVEQAKVEVVEEPDAFLLEILKPKTQIGKWVIGKVDEVLEKIFPDLAKPEQPNPEEPKPIEKHPDQKVSTAVGKDANGEFVNMDLWDFAYDKYDENGNGLSYTLTSETYVGNGCYALEGTGYKGTDFDNIVIPQYIKAENDEDFKAVTALNYTFIGCEGLVKAPEIPSTVTSMYGTFKNCINLKEASVIPNSVTNLTTCFERCISLLEAPAIPNSVTSIWGTFQWCNSIEVAPTVPDSVTDMCYAFNACENLKVGSDIPASIEGSNAAGAYAGSDNLSGTITIYSKNIEAWAGASNTFGGIFTDVNDKLVIRVYKDSETHKLFERTMPSREHITLELMDEDGNVIEDNFYFFMGGTRIDLPLPADTEMVWMWDLLYDYSDYLKENYNLELEPLGGGAIPMYYTFYAEDGSVISSGYTICAGSAFNLGEDIGDNM